MSELVARRCLVSGHVQGVFFRASTRQRANDLGITGYASNLPDGRVEVLMVGEPSATQQLIDWLRRGPPAARVTGVAVEALPLDEIDELPVGFAAK